MREVPLISPPGGVVQVGAIGAGDVSLVFQVSVAADSDVPVLQLALGFGQTTNVTATGIIPGAGEFIEANGTANWGYGDDSLDPGETANPIFLAYSSLTPGEQLTFENVLIEMGTFTVVPEPVAATLLGAGLAALALARRRHARTRTSPER